MAFSRRNLLRLGGLSLYGVTMPHLLSGAQPPTNASTFGRAKRCIFLFMWGGPAHQDTWDLKPQAPAEIRGEFKPISTSVPGVQICEHLPQLAKRTKDLTIIRSMTHTDVNHLSATHYMLTGMAPPAVTDKRVQWPHMGSVLASQRASTSALPPFVSMRPKIENTVPRFVEQSQGQFAGWMGARFDPMTIDERPDKDTYRVGHLDLQPELTIDRLQNRSRLLKELDKQIQRKSSALAASDANRQRAFDLLTSATAGRGAFKLDEESKSIRERYGMNAHGQSVLQARRLIERGVPLVTVYWPNEGIKNVSVYWDTHSSNFVDHKDRLMPLADQAFSALIDDLKQRGLYDDTLIIWGGEFGRTPKVGQRNSDAGAGRDGRDHWPNCYTTVLAGGGVKGGYVHGKSDRQAAYPADNPVQPVDLVATIYHLLGVAPQLEINDTEGRPHVVNPGSPVMELLA